MCLKDSPSFVPKLGHSVTTVAHNLRIAISMLYTELPAIILKLTRESSLLIALLWKNNIKCYG